LSPAPCTFEGYANYCYNDYCFYDAIGSGGKVTVHEDGSITAWFWGSSCYYGGDGPRESTLVPIWLPDGRAAYSFRGYRPWNGDVYAVPDDSYGEHGYAVTVGPSLSELYSPARSLLRSCCLVMVWRRALLRGRRAAWAPSLSLARACLSSPASATSSARGASSRCQSARW
jgi:hypothetical protein